MARVKCSQCLRPEKACICHFKALTKNNVPVVILQHPLEVEQSKGTVTLLAQSLTDCTVIVGEDFSSNEILNRILRDFGERAYLLYPHEQAKAIEVIVNQQGSNDEIFNNTCLILLDATWKKAYKMYMESTNLHTIEKLKLPAGIISHYEIRKTKKNNAFSTLEACCHALALLESAPKKYQPIMNNFIKFNQFQLSFQAKQV